MNAWPRYSVAELQRDGILLVEDGNHGEYRPRPNEFADDGVPFIRAADMAGGRVLFDRAGRINATARDRVRKGIGRPGDILFSHKGTVGKLARVPDTAPEYVCSPQTTFWRTLHEHTLTRAYLYAYMRSQAFIDQWWARKGETDMADYVSLTAQRQLMVIVPPVDMQRAIAEPLTAIDDSIENNRRRIAVLEEMAQAIYREWFVHFRYPGHEDDTFIESSLGPIPDDWAVHHLADVARLVRGRSYRKHELSDNDGLPFVNLKCMMRGGGFRVDGLKRYTGIYKPDQVVEHGDIVLAVTDLTQGREILAQATLIPRLGEERCVISLDVARIVPFEDRERLPLYFTLRCTDFAERVKEFANGSTVLHLSPKYVEQNTLIWPEHSLRRRFAEHVLPMIASLDELRQSADRLAAMRDLLLPKLVSGEVDVSGLDLDVLVEAI